MASSNYYYFLLFFYFWHVVGAFLLGIRFSWSCYSRFCSSMVTIVHLSVVCLVYGVTLSSSFYTLPCTGPKEKTFPSNGFVATNEKNY